MTGPLPPLPPPAPPPHSPLGPALGFLSLMIVDTRSGSWQLVSVAQKVSAGGGGMPGPGERFGNGEASLGAAAPTDSSVRVPLSRRQPSREIVGLGRARLGTCSDIRGAGLFLKAPPA